MITDKPYVWELACGCEVGSTYQAADGASTYCPLNGGYTYVKRVFNTAEIGQRNIHRIASRGTPPKPELMRTLGIYRRLLDGERVRIGDGDGSWTVWAIGFHIIGRQLAGREQLWTLEDLNYILNHFNVWPGEG